MTFWNKRRRRLFVIVFIFLGTITVALLEFLRDEDENLKPIIGIILLLVAFGEAIIEFRHKLKKNSHDESAPADQDYVPTDQELKAISNTLLRVVERTCEDITKNQIIAKINSMVKGNEYIVKPTLHFYSSPRHLQQGNKDHYDPVTWDVQKSNFGLVFIGDPGNGKTYSMADWILELLEPIMKEAEHNSIVSRIPVYLSLSTWNEEDFTEWITEAIVKKYQLGKYKPVIKHLLIHGRLIPCLDGLDEVAPENIPQCLTNIIAFAPKNSMIFSCRRAEFFTLLQTNENIADVQFIKILSLEKLSKEAIERTLKEVPAYSQMSELLKNHSALFEYINTPLFLNLFIITFHSFSILEKEGLVNIEQSAFENQIWSKYESLMFSEKLGTRKKSALKKQASIQAYLSVLAVKMTSTAFYVEQLQPKWLPGRIAAAFYYIVSRTFSGLLVAVATGLIIATPFAFLGNGIFASMVIVFLTLLLNSKFRIVPRLNRLHPVFLFVFVLTIIMALYQGFSVPRSTEGDMIGTFALTESFSGILLGLFFGCLFGYRKLWQSRDRDIQPLEKFSFQWKQALRIGIRSGLGIGFLMGLSGVIIRFSFSASSFGKWLKLAAFNSTSSLRQSASAFMSILFEYISVFIFGFSVGFLVGGLIFLLMGGRKREEIEILGKIKEEISEYKLNVGIRKSLLISLKSGAVSFVIMTSAYGCFIYFFNRQPEGFIRAVMIGIGTGIISFLWFGGIEVIQHWVLRIFLYVYGLIPLRYGRWISDTRRLAFLRQVGASLEFYHPTLRRYYSNLRFDRNKIVNVRKMPYLLIGMILFLTVSSYFAILPLYERNANYYWQKPEGVLLSGKPDPMKIFQSDFSEPRFVILRNGFINLEITGRIYIGTFSGSTGPEGTETGIFGFPMNNVYDLDTSTYRFRHGALLYRVKNRPDSFWHNVITYNGYLFPWQKRKGQIRVNKGDSIEFSVNDREWQNNKGNFRVTIELTDSVNQLPVKH